jgi:hypothetical protein
MPCVSHLPANVLILSLLALPALAAENNFPPFLSSKMPYVAQQSAADYQTPPAGYQLVFTELVARHGARTMTGDKSDQLMYQIWLRAEKERALTPLGKQLGPQLQALLAADKKLGYGELTQLGKEEHQQLAQRLYQRDAALFLQAIQQGKKISVWHSGKGRAVDSAENFVIGLKQAQPELAPLLLPAQENQAQLYFHKTEASKAYRHYLKKNTQLKNTLHEITTQVTSHQMARRVLLTLFSDEFVSRLSRGQYRFESEGGDEKPINELDTARMLYELYAITPGMQYEGQWKFSKFMPKAAAEWFAYLNDAEDFYEKGPAFKGQDVTYKMAQSLVTDFFDSIAHVVDGSSAEAARLRFTHAEVVVPFVTLLQLPESDKPATLLKPYRYDNNPWRGESVVPMAANIQWDVYRDAQQHYLVKMLYNEKETRFKADCRPTTADSYYYDFSELKRCYHQTAL